jgi:hypothetical protein
LRSQDDRQQHIVGMLKLLIGEAEIFSQNIASRSDIASTSEMHRGIRQQSNRPTPALGSLGPEDTPMVSNLNRTLLERVQDDINRPQLRPHHRQPQLRTPHLAVETQIVAQVESKPRK